MEHSLEEALAPDVDYVVHIGAGTGAEVSIYLAAGLDPIILVEADPQILVHLRMLEQQHDAVQVIEAAVTSRTGAQLFYRSNFSDLSALAKPGEALKELFPGVKTIGQEPMMPIDPVMVLQQCSLSADQAGLLVIEAPGEALGILEALKEAGMLNLFTDIRAQEGLVSLYEGAPGLDGLRAALEVLDYQVTQETQPEDPDRPYVVAHRARLSREASQTMQALTVALQESEAALAVQQAQNDTISVQLRLKLALIDGMLAELAAQAQRLESAESEVADLRATLDALRESAESEVADLRATLDALRESAEVEATDLRTSLERETQARQMAEGRFAETEFEAQQKLQQDHEAALAAQAAKTDLIQQNLTVALRMQDLREADLRELQLRYGELKSRKEAQDSLLHRVQAGLSQQLQASVSASASLPASDVETVRPPTGKESGKKKSVSGKNRSKKKRSGHSKRNTGK